MIPRPPRSTLFPFPTLFRSRAVLPRRLLAAAVRLLRPDRRPAAELAGHVYRALEPNGRPVTKAVAQEEFVRHLVQPRRAKGFDRRGPRPRQAVQVEVLLEGCLQRLQRVVGAGDDAGGVVDVVAIV